MGFKRVPTAVCGSKGQAKEAGTSKAGEESTTWRPDGTGGTEAAVRTLGLAATDPAVATEARGAEAAEALPVEATRVTRTAHGGAITNRIFGSTRGIGNSPEGRDTRIGNRRGLTTPTSNGGMQ